MKSLRRFLTAVLLAIGLPASAEIIGVEQFDYPDGSIADKNGGTFWNWRNQTPAGRTTTGPSDWDGGPSVINGRLTTSNSSAEREYNGPGEGLPITTDEGLGAISAFNNGTLSFLHKTVYYRVTLTTGASLTPDLPISLISSDFGTDSVVFGKLPGGSNFAIRDLRDGNATTTSGTAVAANTTYTLVAKLDFGNGATGTASLFLNPDLNAPEPSPLVSRTFISTFWSSRLKLSSGTGGSPVTWDDLVIATSWDSLGTVVTTLDDEDNLTLGGGAGVSLREAVKYSPTGSLITFAPGLSGGTITLTHADGDMEIPGALTIDASALPGGLTVSGNNTSRHFFVEFEKSLTLRGLTLTGGNGSGPLNNNGSGGAINNDGGTLTLTQCTLSGNSANFGGAIYNGGPTLTLTQCTLSGNQGGAIYNSGTLTLTQCTLSGNSASNQGGAIFNGRRLTLTNSIVAGNSLTGAGGSGADIFNERTVTLVGTNLVQSLVNDGGTENGSGTIINADPKLSPLGWFGGPVQTMHPLIGSPAIDAAGTTDPGGTDARGFPRFVDGNDAGGAQLDIGAVEAGPLRTVESVGGSFSGLRAKIAASTEPGARIGFDSSVFPALHIEDLSGEFTIAAGRTFFIDASSLTGPVTISGRNLNRVFNIPATATVAMHSVRIVNGEAPSFENGGGILNAGTCTLMSSTVSGNSADSGGGIYSNGAFSGNAVLSLTGCTISGNQSTTNGGGILSSGTSGRAMLNLTSCTVSGNSAGYDGGGLYNRLASLNLSACTISGNTAVSYGGGIYSTKEFPGVQRPTLGLHNTIVAGNSSGQPGANLEERDTDTTQTGINLIGGAPLLAPLGDYGGPTQTMPPLPGSPAIDAATATAAQTDQRGFPLFGLPDIGAYEAQISDIANVTTNEDNAATTASFSVGQIGTLEAFSGNTTLIPHANIVITGSGASRTVTLTPAANQSGTATITVTDTTTGESQDFLLTVTAVNDAPTISNLADRTISEDANTGAVAFTIGDVETAAASLTESGTSSNTTLVPNANITFGGSGANRTVTVTPAANQSGTATITVTVNDGLATASDTFLLTVTAVNDTPVHTTHLAVDGANTPLAPGAGTNGLPADAKLTSFGPPATSDAGDVAFVGKWKSATSKGTGLFLNDQCLAIVGGPAPIAGARYVSFTDPVVDGGKVVCIAKLTGTPKPPASVVLSNVNTGGALEVLAQTGGNATADGAKFKAFKSVAISDRSSGSLGIFAQLAAGTGTAPKTTAANDLGLWIVERGTLSLALREGQLVEGKTIKTLVSFLPGAGSPGQGRGWLGNDGDPEVHALAIFTDKTQGVVLKNTDLSAPQIISVTGATADGAPDIAGATFATYGPPARNEAGATTFLATLKVDATSGVTKADARGIFLNPASTGKFTPLARIGKPAGVNSAVFSKLSDPVLSPDSGVAFLATLKGGTAKGQLTKTLWWKPVGQPLTLLAQGSARPGLDLPAEAQWKSFDSIAITDRGPLFAAKLVANKGGVTAKTATGVWACDFDGEPRALFRTGDVINGKTLAKFTLLKVTVGNAGVTRSFNNTAQVVWLATFTDKTTAIVITEVP